MQTKTPFRLHRILKLLLPLVNRFVFFNPPVNNAFAFRNRDIYIHLRPWLHIFQCQPVCTTRQTPATPTSVSHCQCNLRFIQQIARRVWSILYLVLLGCLITGNDSQCQKLGSSPLTVPTAMLLVPLFGGLVVLRVLHTPSTVLGSRCMLSVGCVCPASVCRSASEAACGWPAFPCRPACNQSMWHAETMWCLFALWLNARVCWLSDSAPGGQHHGGCHHPTTGRG